MDIQSIQKTSELLTDKETLEILKTINDNVITKSTNKGKKSVDPNLVGWADGCDICGEKPESKSKKQSKDQAEYDYKQSKINKLKESNLIVEGQHTPLVENQKAGEPDRLDKPIRKFKVTNEGSALLDLAEQLGLVKNVSKKSKDLADEVQDNNPDAASEKGNVRTKSDQKREDKESDDATKRTLANQKARKS